MTINSKIGFGEKVTGQAVILKNGVRSVDLTFDLDGTIVVFLDSPAREIVEKARFVGVLGVVVPEIHYRDFSYFQNFSDFAMMVVQKFGNESISSEIKEKLKHFDGKHTELNGNAHEFKTV